MDSDDADDEGGWCITIGTGGRPIRCPLPPDLTEHQRLYISERLPTKAKLMRSAEHFNATTLKPDDSERIDVLRTVTQEVCEKKIELLELERETSRLRLELQQLNHNLDERKKHAKSLAGALQDLFSGFDGGKKTKAK